MRRSRACLGILAGLAVLAASPVAIAQAASAIDMTEHTFGASNTNAVAGHGGLTVGISDDGDVSVLSWPGPSFADQLQYLAGNDLDVRSRPHLGADDGMGAYLGLLVTTASGTQLVWLRDPSFTHAQTYTQPYAPVPQTTFARADLGLTVVVTDVVSPDVDVLTRRVVVTRASGSPVTAASLVSYENLSPTLSRIAELPFADWLLDSHNDFLAVYDRAAGAVIHVHPRDRAIIAGLLDIGADPTLTDYGPADAVMRRGAPTDADVDALVAGLDSTYPPGVAAIVTTEPAPAAFQVGADATPFCASVGRWVTNLQALPTAFPGFTLPIDPNLADAVKCTDPLPSVSKARGWAWSPQDALADVADGHLSRSRVAACQTNATLVAPLSFQGGIAEGSAVFAFGKSVADARAALAKATSQTAAQRQATSEAAAKTALGSANLPDASLGQRTVDVAQRALVNIYVARDRGTGAVVAGISRQPPYYLDWPRDGSFITHAMVLAGLQPWGAQRGEWYVGIQRTQPAAASAIVDPKGSPTDPDTGDVQYPAYAWEMNYYADGALGGNIRWEIDNTALHLWAMTVEAASLKGADRAAFIAKVWPSYANALHLLVRWKDKTTGLPWPANEDDHFDLSSTLHGATAVYAALVSGARLGFAAGDAAAANEALARAAELESAMETYYYDGKVGLFVDTPIMGTDYIPGTTGVEDTAWLVWPARFLSPDDPRLEAQLASDMASVMPAIEGQTEGGAYVMKNVVSAALLGKDGGSRDLARKAVGLLAAAATPDTMQFGEVFVTSHPGGPGAAPVFSQRVAAPHVWEGTLFYLSAMALSAPGAFDPQTTELPLPATPGPAWASGSGCAAAGESGGAWWTLPVIAALLGGVFLARRRGVRADSAR